jgi:hypothetical protein
MSDDEMKAIFALKKQLRNTIAKAIGALSKTEIQTQSHAVAQVRARTKRRDRWDYLEKR